MSLFLSEICRYEKKLKSTSEAKLTLIQLFQQNQYKRISYKNYNKVLKNMIKVNN